MRGWLTYNATSIEEMIASSPTKMESVVTASSRIGTRPPEVKIYCPGTTPKPMEIVMEFD